MDTEIFTQVMDLCGNGDFLCAEQKYDEALVLYEQAWALLPEPKIKIDAATFVLAALGDAAFNKGDFAKTREYMLIAVSEPSISMMNPFFALRLGQAEFELGNLEEARKFIKQAAAFKDEDPMLFEDVESKYLDIL